MRNFSYIRPYVCDFRLFTNVVLNIGILLLLILAADKVNAQQDQRFVGQVDLMIQRQLDFEHIYYSDAGNYLATPVEDEIIIWDARTLRQLRKFQCTKGYWSKDDIQIVEEKSAVGCRCEGKWSSEILKFYDLMDGSLIQMIEPKETLKGYSFFRDEYYTNPDDWERDGVAVHSISENRFLHEHPQNVRNIHYDRTNDLILAIKQGQKVVALDAGWQGQLFEVETASNAEYVKGFELSSDGRSLLLKYPYEGSIFEGGSSPWEVVDVETGNRTTGGELAFGFNDVAFTADGRSICYIDFIDSTNDQGYNYLAVFEQALNQPEATPVHVFYAANDNGLGTHPHANKLAFRFNDQIYILNLEIGEIEARSPKGIPDEFTRLDHYDNGRRLLVSQWNVLHQVDLEDPSNYSRYEIMGNNNYAIPAGGSFWVYEDEAQYRESGEDYWVTYRIVDGRKPDAYRTLTLMNETMEAARMLKDGNRLLTYCWTANDKGHLILYDLEQDEVIGDVSFKPEKINVLLADQLVISPDERYLYFPMGSDAGSYHVQLLDLQDGLNRAGTITGAEFVLPTKDSEIVVKARPGSLGANEFYTYNIGSSDEMAYIGSATSALSEMAVVGDDGYLGVADDYELRLLPLNGQSNERAIQHGLNRLRGCVEIGDFIVVYSDAQSIWLNKDDLEERFKIIASERNGFMTALPDGSYLIPAGERPDIVNFVIEDRAYPFDQFDLKFNRPDKVMQCIGLASDDLIATYSKAYQKRLQRNGISEDAVIVTSELPQVHLDLEQIPSVTSNSEVVIHFTGTDANHKLDKVNIWVNGCPFFGIHDRKLEDPTKEITFDYRIPLSRGKNDIRVSVKNEQGVESLRESVNITSKTPEQDTKTHYIGIGVSNYQDSTHDLTYAAKDVEDLTTALKQQYPNLVSYTFIDEEAKREDILALKEELLETNVDDQIILSLSGHGVLDDNLDFYYATYDMDFDSPSERGLLYDDIEWLLDSIPARKKLVLMDACHSGEVDKEDVVYVEDGEQKKEDGFEEGVTGRAVTAIGRKPKIGIQNSFTLMQELFADLSRGNGAVVISAAGGLEYAFEDDRWSNGVFTYSVLRGLEDMEADENDDGEVTVSELKAFVSDEVQRLTKGRQKPTSRQENLEFDFVVW